jgi:hypothetical protein
MNMAVDQKLSQLPAASALTGAEALYVLQGGVDKSATVSQIAGGSGGAGVASLNGLSGALSLVGGGGITVAPGGSNITIASPTDPIFATVTANRFIFSPGSINAQTGTSYTLNANDNGRVVTLNNSAPVTLTCPPGLGSAFSCTVIQLGVGLVTATAGGGATLLALGGSLSFSGQYAMATVVAPAANNFVIAGQLGAGGGGGGVSTLNGLSGALAITAGAAITVTPSGSNIAVAANSFGTGAAGVVPASGGGTANFLRADGTWAAPPAGGGGTPGGSTLQIQYNNAGAFGGMAGSSWDNTNHALSITGTAHAGATVPFSVLPDSGVSSTKIFDNGSMIIDGDPGTASTMLTIRSGGVGVFSFGFAGEVNLFSNSGGISFSSGRAYLFAPRAKVLAVGASGIGVTDGFYNWGGQKRVTADVNSNNTTTLALLTGLSVALAAGETYSFDVYLPFTCTAAQGIRAAMVGTGGLTATAIQYDGWIVDSAANGIKGNAPGTALGAVVANAAITGTAGVVQIKGTITVGVAGNLEVQFAQSVAASNNTTAKRGSLLMVWNMP